MNSSSAHGVDLSLSRATPANRRRRRRRRLLCAWNAANAVRAKFALSARNLCRWRVLWYVKRLATLVTVALLAFMFLVFALGWTPVALSNFWQSVDYSIYYSLLKENKNGSFCALPQLDPWDASIREFLSVVEPLKCKRLHSELTYFDFTQPRILFNDSELRSVGYDSVAELHCQFRCFRKWLDNDFDLDYDKWQTLTNGSQTNCEFVEVRCYGGKYSLMPFYENTHAQISDSVHSSVTRSRSPSGNSISSKTVYSVDDQRTADEEKNRKENDKKSRRRRPSVLLFVVDSVSRSAWLRNLPKTLRVLRYKYNATIFEGLTKIADNSYPNAVAFLTGKRVYARDFEPELQEDMSADFFDDWPLIWRDFKNQGYVTFYAEDFINFNLFTYLSKGFRKKPTDHYFRPYWLHVKNGLLQRRSSSYCYGNRPKHQLQLDYLKRFIRKYDARHESIFALNWLTELSHNWMNQVSAGDADFAKFFSDTRASLEDAFVFTFADHGHRFDRIRQSLLGRIEERMPFFSVHAPKWLHADVPTLRATIEQNAKRLTTFWDLYITLRDILYLAENDAWHELHANVTAARSNAIERRFREWSPRGLSLLRPIPLARNCETADVPPEFCVCQREHEVNANSARVHEAAQFLVAHVNAMLRTANASEMHMCAHLTLSEVASAQVFLPNYDLMQTPKYRSLLFGGTPYDFFLNYRVMIKVSPSDAMLEATVRTHLPNGDYTVVGDVNRINKYDNQSACVYSPILRKYCYCI